MSSVGFFHQPLEFYHGRIPFIVVDLIKRLRELDAESSADILNEDNVGNNIDQIIDELNMRPIKNWKNYKNVSTLSIVLVRYLNSITFDEPLFTNSCKEPLVEANLTLKSPNYAHVFRKNLVNLYPGNYRTILAVTDFLRNVETTSLDAMFEQFGPSFFGKNAIQRNRSQFRVLFIHLLIHHSEIFKGAILGPAAYLTPQQIAVLERRLVEKSSSNNSSNEKDPTLVTPRNAVAPQTPKSPTSSHNSQKNSYISKSHKNSTKNVSSPNKISKTRERKIKEQFLSAEDYEEEEDNQYEYESQNDQANSYTYQYYASYYEEDINSYSDENNDRKSNPKKSKNSPKSGNKSKSKNSSNKKSGKSPKSSKRKQSRNHQKQSQSQNQKDVVERDIPLAFQEGNQAKVLSPTFSNTIIADIKPSAQAGYVEASAQAACLTMTSVKAIFSNDVRPIKKSNKNAEKSDNSIKSEEEEYSNHNNENEQELSISLDFAKDRNAKLSDDNIDSNNDLGQSNSSSLITSESYHRNCIAKIKIDEKIRNQSILNEDSSQKGSKTNSSEDLFQTD